MKIIEPRTPGEYEKYFQLRYEVLRKPWGRPPGSERDNEEDKCIHAMCIDETGTAIAVCRLQLNSPTQGQLRYMAVAPEMQGKGTGALVLKYMEDKARDHNLIELVLQARENAVNFYRKNGYDIIEKSYLLWGQIQHYLMRKKLTKDNSIH